MCLGFLTKSLSAKFYLQEQGRESFWGNLSIVPARETFIFSPFPVFLKYFLSRIKLTHDFLISRVSGLKENTRAMPLVAGTSQVALVVKNPTANAGDVRDTSSTPGWEDLLEKEMTTHSSILTREITEEPDGLTSIGSQLDMTEVI